MQINLPGVIVDASVPTPPATTAVPARQDIVVYQGVDTVIQVTVTGSNSVAFNLTGYTAQLTIKDRVLPSEGQPRFAKTYAGTLTNPTAGVVQFSIPGSDLKALNLVGYWYDAFVTSGAGKRDEVVQTSTVTVWAALGA